MILLEALKTSLIVSEAGLKWYKDNANIEVGDNKISLELLKRLLTDEDYIREVIAFPLTQQGLDLLMKAPAEVTEKQLRELHIKIR